MFRIEKMDLLIALYIACIAVSELMGAKTFPIAKVFGLQLNASVAIFVIPLIFTINDVIVEVYGKERARSVVRSGLGVIVFFFLFSWLATALPASVRFLQAESAYDTIFHFSMRISLASLTAFTVAEFLDVYIFAKLRERLVRRSLWFRNNLSNFISQFVDTVVFMSIAFYAFNRPFGDNITFLLSIALPYWGLKCVMSVLETPLVYLGVSWLQNGKKAK